MSLASWLADGGEPGRMSPEEVRRQLNLLAVREEQVIARLEARSAEQTDLVDRGTWTRSEPLRRALARRHGRLDEDVVALDRELSRIGKEMAGLTAIKALLRDGVPLAAPGDCAPLLAQLDDTGVSDAEFSDQLERSLRAGDVPRGSARKPSNAPDLIEVWKRLDRGEVTDVREAMRRRPERDA